MAREAKTRQEAVEKSQPIFDHLENRLKSIIAAEEEANDSGRAGRLAKLLSS